MKESEKRFRLLLEFAPEAIVVVDTQGQIRFTNIQTESIFGYTHAELLGQPIEILIPERYVEQHVYHRAAYSAAPGARYMGVGRDLAGRRKDGSEFPIEVGLSAIETADGLLVAAFLADITERKRAEANLKRYSQRMEILHEIDNGIINGSPIEVVMTNAIQGIRQIIPCKRASVGLFDYESNE